MYINTARIFSKFYRVYASWAQTGFPSKSMEEALTRNGITMFKIADLNLSLYKGGWGCGLPLTLSHLVSLTEHLYILRYN